MPDIERSNNFRIRLSDLRGDLVTLLNPLPMTDRILEISSGAVPGHSMQRDLVVGGAS